MAHAREVGSQEGAAVDGVGSSDWRKSTRSIGNGQCVEAAKMADGRLAMRDSTDKAGPVILQSPGEWLNFLRAIKVGDL
ncbi:MAG TPA: DUF397 domain-containing protein [Trebonia sp.]|jgi:hypothetical protein